jgi:hypothetical protein
MSTAAKTDDEIREAVRDTYAKAATAAGGGCCRGESVLDDEQRGIFGQGQYDPADREGLRSGSARPARHTDST